MLKSQSTHIALTVVSFVLLLCVFPSTSTADPTNLTLPSLDPIGHPSAWRVSDPAYVSNPSQWSAGIRRNSHSSNL